MMSDKRLEIRSGFTLIEVLLAVTLGLILMLGVVQMFAMVGNFVTGAQSLMELDQKVRSAQIMLQNDLVRYSAKMTVPSEANSGMGYFRFDENASSAVTTSPDTRLNDFYGQNLTGIVGDNDDVLTFTIHDLDSHFIGHGSTNGNYLSYEHSPYAEVKWFVHQDATTHVFSLYRSISVLWPAKNRGQVTPTTSGVEATAHIKGVSLSELTFSSGTAGSGRGGGSNDKNYRTDYKATNIGNGELVLDNIIIFDVKVWDPEAPNPTQSNPDNKGKFVDLTQGATFNAMRGNTFDTGNQFKISGNAVNKDTTTPVKTGSGTSSVINALDSAKFSAPVSKMAGVTLQGIQVHVRTFDPSSGIIRDFTVEQEFVTH